MLTKQNFRGELRPRDSLVALKVYGKKKENNWGFVGVSLKKGFTFGPGIPLTVRPF